MQGAVLPLLLSTLAAAPAWPAPPLVTADGDVRPAPTSTASVPAVLPALPGVPPEVPRPPVSVREADAPRPSPEPRLVPAPGRAAAAPSHVTPPPASRDAVALPSAAPVRALDAPVATREAPAWGGAPMVERRIEPRPSREQPWLGAQFDVGFPDGVGGSAMVMPWDWLRVQVGGSWNGASRGVRAGLVALLFPSFFKSVRPTVSVEGGYAFDTDSRWLVNLVEDPALKAALSRVTVLHGGGQLGLEFGSKYFSVFLRGGVSYVDVQLGEYEGDSAAVRGLQLHGLFPSGKLGFLVCFL